MSWLFKSPTTQLPDAKSPSLVVGDALISEVKHYMELCYQQRKFRSLSITLNEAPEAGGGSSIESLRRQSQISSNSSTGNGGNQENNSESIPRVNYSWLATSTPRLGGSISSSGALRRRSSIISRNFIQNEIDDQILNVVPEGDIRDQEYASELPYMTELENAELESLASKVKPEEYVTAVKIFRKKLGKVASDKLARALQQRRDSSTLPSGGGEKVSDSVTQLKNLRLRDDDDNAGKPKNTLPSIKLPNSEDADTEFQEHSQINEKNYSSTSLTSDSLNEDNHFPSHQEHSPTSTTSFAGSINPTNDDNSTPTNAVMVANRSGEFHQHANSEKFDLSAMKPREIPNVMRLAIYRVMDMRGEQSSSSPKAFRPSHSDNAMLNNNNQRLEDLSQSSNETGTGGSFSHFVRRMGSTKGPSSSTRTAGGGSRNNTGGGVIINPNALSFTALQRDNKVQPLNLSNPLDKGVARRGGRRRHTDFNIPPV